MKYIVEALQIKESDFCFEIFLIFIHQWSYIDRDKKTWHWQKKSFFLRKSFLFYHWLTCHHVVNSCLSFILFDFIEILVE
jgi:hypothetical protein